MNISLLFQGLIKRGAKLWIEGDQLRCQGSGEVLTTEVLEILKQHKSEFLDLLRKKTPEPEEYPLSHGQQALWFLNHEATESAVYNTAASLRICSPLDVVAMERAFQYLLDRHPLLRAYFPVQDGKPQQRIRENQSLRFEIIDATDGDEEQLRQQVVQTYQQPFDLEAGPLLRIHLFRRSDEDHVYLLTVHHIVFDAWSGWLFMDEFSKAYSSITAGKTPSLVPLQHNYQNYIQWQTDMLAGPEGEKLWQYWQKKLAGEIPVLQLATDRPRPPVQTFHGATIGFSIDETLTRQLRELARIEGTTLFTVLMAAFNVLLHRYTGQDDIIVGSPTVGRDNRDFTGIAGYFVNPVVIRTDSSGNPTFQSFLQKVSEAVLGAIGHQDYPFPLLVKRLQPKRSSGFSPLFQVDFVLQKVQVGGFADLFYVTGKTEAAMNWGGLEIQPFVIPQQEGQFDLTLEIIELEDSLSGHFKYNTDLFDAGTIERMSEHFRILLDGIINNHAECISHLPLLSETEKQQLQAWNKTEKEYPKDKTIYQLFEEQVLKTPENMAVVFPSTGSGQGSDQQLTYAELNAKSNQLARYLQSQATIKSDTLIALCLDRSIEMIIGILGAMKAGGAYVPIDPEYPAERIKYILDDTQTDIILTQSHLAERLQSITDVNVIELDSDCYQDKETTSLATQNRATDLAYIFYTSGTAGNPNGVMVEHRSLSNLIFNQISSFNIHSEKIVLFASYVFDASVEQIFLSLLSGSSLYIPSLNDIKDTYLFEQFLLENQITHLHATPSYLIRLAFKYNDTKLKRVVSGAEEFNRNLISKYSGLILNEYGPTETSVTSSQLFIKNSDIKISIGTPIANVLYFVLDPEKNPVPQGAIGELHIGGSGLARGYLNQPELTTQKFIPNSFATDGDIEKGYTRLYKTGDLVRWLPDGNLEYIGRNDFQIKIRGYRIELGEIENALTSFRNIKQACVLAKEKSGNKYLAGYFVSDTEIAEDSIIKQLANKLPDYMIPGALVKMESFPLTINGKLDRKALPDPEFTNEESYVVPTTDLEIKLCKIWQEVLNLEKVGITDDFFRIGGDSILSIQLSSRLRTHNFNCGVKDVFDNRTIQKLARFIASDINKTEIIAEQGVLEGRFNLLPIQKWFFDKVEKNQFKKFNHWNQSFMVNVPKLETTRLQHIVQRLTEQHDILRVVYSDNQQEYLAKIDFPQLEYLNIKNLSEQDINNKLTNWQSNFNINKTPLCHIAYIEGYEDNSARLFFALHHLIVDAVSWRILIEDFKTLYNNETLENKSSSYRQWVKEVSLYAEKNPQEKDYWNNILKSISPCNVIEQESTFSSVKMNKESTSALLQQANEAYHTEINDLLLTALGLTLQSWNKDSTQSITLEGHGRENINETIDHSRTVGWFTTMYPVQLELQDNLELCIKEIKESLRRIPDKGIGFGAIYPDELINLPVINFNYLGQFDTQDEQWQVVSENAGIAMHSDNIDSNIININGMVLEGELSFSVVTKLGREETIAFASNFQRNLETIVLHCNEIIENNRTQYTPSDFKSVKISQQLLDKIQKDKDNQIEDIYLANSLQQGFLYHVLSQPEDDAYRVQILFDYNHELNIDNYIKSWELAIEKYPILRTAFNWEEEIIQIVYSNARLNYQVLDISDLSEPEKEEYIINLQEEDRNIAFDLTRPCLLRLYIIKQNSNNYTIIKSEHHTISDGWSGPLLLNTIHKNYYDLQQNRQIIVITDNSYLEAQGYFAKHKDNIERYWQARISLIEQTNDLNPLLSKKQDLDDFRSLENSYDTTMEIRGDLYQQLKELTKTEGVTLNSIIQFAWHKLIQVYTQDNQTIVGTTVSGRDIPVSGIEESVGLYINTLPLIIEWDNENTVLQQVEYIHQQITDINSNSFADLAGLQLDGKRLFHSLLVFENYPMPEPSGIISKDSLTPKLRYAVEKLDYPIGITAYEQEDKLVISLKSDREILDREKANYNLGKIRLLLVELLADLDKKHSGISTLTQAEYQQIVIDWNRTDKEYPKDKTICQLFEEQVLKTPDNVSVVFEDQQLTYAELNAKSNQLARYLQSQTTIKPDTLIALCLDRSLEMIIGILGIMKADGAYVPIDPGYPAERINYILEDTQTKIVLTQSHLVERLQNITDVNLIELDSDCYQNQETTNLAIHNRATDLAYVIYTSGTTGKPKGTCLSHTSLNNLVINQINKFNIKEKDNVLLFASLIFDASVSELFTSIVSGACLNIISEENRKSSKLFITYLVENNINVATIPPVFLSALELKELKELKTLVVAGESCPGNLMKTWSNGRTLINAYGPTESTVCATMHEYKDGDSNINIGKPLNNIKCYVLDTNNKPSPIGVIGELYIRGAGLATGYLNQSELTAETFILNPFATDGDIEKGYTRLYKTGDMVRWLPDGNLEYIGRNDFQVKIRGYRIEPGEIESALTSIEGVKQACVLAKEKDGSKYLVAYYVSDTEIKEENILKQLSKQLPDNMLPGVLVKMESFPLTINGKLDRKALPDPEFTSEESYVVPTTDLEIKLCNIWQEVLNLEKVSITDDFFRIGGDSILSIQLSSRLRKHNFNCGVKDIFENRTIQKLAKFIESDINKTEIITEQGLLEGKFDLLPIQKWFFDKVEKNQFSKFNHWNQSFMVNVPKLETTRLQTIIQTLTEQHDILRVVYSDKQQEYLAKIDIPPLEYLNIRNISEQDINNKLTNWQSNFNINKIPLCHIAYIEGYEDDSARLFFALHHLIVDAVSWRILIEDFKSLYNNDDLENKTSSYRQWVKEVSLYAEKNPEEKDYWNNILKSISPRNVIEQESTFSSVKMNKESTSALLQQANEAYHTEINDLLLTALALTLQDWNKESTQSITLEGHGRENINETIDHSRTVGWFTTMYPVKLELHKGLESSIKGIKESLRRIPGKGIGFGAIYPNELINLPAISFNYLGQFDTQDEQWQVVSENAGIAMHTDNIDSNIININGMVLEGELSFSVVTKLGREETIAFANNFQRNLETIVLHCNEIIENNQTQYTPSDFKSVKISQQLLDNIQKDKDNQIEDIYLANSLQQGFLYHVLSQPEDDAYRVQILFDYNHELNIDNYIKSWELAIEKYPILRTAFNWEEEIIQIVYSNARLNYQVLDISDLSEPEKEEYIIKLQKEDRYIAFDLTKPCLLRLYIIKQDSNNYTIIKSEHHTISDGWSGPLLLNTIHKNYYELQQNRQIRVITDNSYLEAQGYYAKHKNRIEKHWKEKISRIEQTNDLNPLLSRKQDLDDFKSLDNSYDTTMEIRGDLYRQLKELTKTEGVTLNSIIQFAWHKLIQVYTQDNKTIVGTTVSGRDIPVSGIEESVGLYINTLPLIINWDNENTVLQQLQYIHQQITEINSNSFADLASLQQDAKRLFHSLLVFENYPMPEPSGIISKDSLTPEFRYAVEKLDYPLGLTAYEQADKLVISLKSDSEILDAEKANYNLDKIRLLLVELLANLDKRHSGISTLTQTEYQQIVIEWNRTDREYPKDKTICQLFEEQVLKTPDNVSVVFEDQQLTYAELNAKSNQLARYLQSHTTIKPDTLIALCLDRSIEMIIGILGTMKAGGAYVPIDPEYPEERINYILEDTQTKIVLTESCLVERLQNITDVNLIELDSDCYQNLESTDLIIQNGATDLAYVIYTSGTTGKPKGVLQMHGNVQRLFSATDHQFDFSNNDIWTLYHSYIFDFSVWEIWGALTFGGKLVIPNNETVKDIPAFVELCIRNKVSVLNQTPSAFYTFVDNLSNVDVSKLSIKQIIFGGDALNINLLDDWWKVKKKYDLDTKLINMYGITETTVHVTYKEILGDKKEFSNIGTAISDLTSYVLDINNKPTPIGIAGELHIGGSGLARGYLNQPELTTQKFIPNPFVTDGDLEKGYTRLYKTGDLVKWLPDGNLEYIGRNDFQVKIRGYRIELGEIESALTSIENIKQACVLANEKKGSKYLVGYFVTESSIEIKEENILDQLTTQLPEYMVPTALVKMETFPLTINGKLDRKALPYPEFTNEDTYLVPSTDLEIKLCKIWQEVLNLEKVDITDDFFRIGGDSIISIRVVSKIKKLDIEISVRDIFIYKTIENLSRILRHDSLKISTYHEFSLIDKSICKKILNNRSNISDIYPAGYLQKGMILESELSNDGTYHDVFSYQINKKFNYNQISNILGALIEKHELLRASFLPSEEYGYLTVINNKVSPQDKICINNNYSDLNSFLEKESLIKFDYKIAGLYKFYVLNQTSNSFILVFSFHHAITDGWSVASFISEFTNAYVNDLAILKENLPMYGEFIKEELWSINNEQNLRFWRNYLLGYEYESLNLKLNSPSVNNLSKFNQIRSSYTLTDNQNRNIFNFAAEYETSVDVIFMSLYQFLLSVFLNKPDITIGIVANNRLERDGGDKLFGLHLNTIPLRQHIGNEPLEVLILKTRDNKARVYKYKSYPYGKLKSDLNLSEDIYQCAFNYIHFHIVDEQYKNNSISGSEVFEKTNIPLVLNIGRSDKRFSFEFQGDINVIDIKTLEMLKNYMVYYLEQLSMDNPKENKLKRIPDKEYQQIVIDWNRTDKEYSKDKTIYQLFEEQVLKTPDNISVVFEDQQLTYAELSAKSNQLARYLQSQATIKPDTLIALCLDRSIEMIIGILGIMKAGGAYVPIDPEYPEERVNYILEDTQTELVLTQSHLVIRLQKITDVNLIDLHSDCYQNLETTDLPIQNKSSDLAYVIYTSGTTGKPKGTMVEHTSICNYIKNMYKYFENITNVDYSSNLSFDLSVTTTLLPLSIGKRIYIYGDKLTNITNYLEHINNNKIDFIKSTPSFLTQIPFDRSIHKVNSCFIGGEKSDINQIEYLRNYIDNVYDEYGPTETTVGATNILQRTIINSIGCAYSNYKLYNLDVKEIPTPVGVIGELHIGGAGLARGYLNKPGLTAEMFIPNPFATNEDIEKGYTRLYKTGDLVKWLPDGYLEYIGRNDFQVKIRGYRIELGEIENALTSIASIKQACVLAKDKDDNKYLVGYFVTENSIEIKDENILNQLSKQLPDYMVPGALVKMESFPLTINGKLDRKAFPDPEFTSEESYVVPTTDLEIKLCKIWQEVLNLEKVGITDDFFRIGGESILAIKLSLQISKELDSHIAVADVFKYTTVSGLVDYLNSNKTEHIKVIPQNLNKYPLSFAQERLWFIEQYEQGTNAYHMPMFVELDENTDKNKLKNVIQQIIQRHEVLRTIFKQVDGEFYQIVIDDKLKINEYNNSEIDIREQIDRHINTPFDLEKDFPIRVSFYHKDNITYLLVNIHHTASDGWSIDILINEIIDLYHDKKLSKLSIQYKDFAHWQREYLHGEVLQNQLNYWKEKLQGYELLVLPTDKARPKQIDYSGDDIVFTINKELSNKLRDLSKEQGCTMYTTLLSGFYILLNKYTSQDDIVLGTPIANRHYPEIQDLIGFFVNSLALRENINLNNSIVEFISQVQNSLIEAQSHQDLPFEKLVEVRNVEQDTSRHPIFQVMFGVQSFGSDARNNLFKFPTLNSVYSIAKYDLTCFLDDSQKEIQGVFNFATALYEKSTIERMVSHYQIVLEQMMSDKNKKLKDYRLLTNKEYQQIVIEWNKTDKVYAKDKTICQLFEEQVLKTADNIAVVFEDRQLTYYELNAKANQLARYLQSQTTIKPDTLIALCLDRSLEMIIGILGIMKADGAYVPIDPEYPAERIKYILDDTQTAIVLTQSHLVGKLQKITDINLIELDSDCYQNQEITNLPIQNKATDLAYVIYTSGTTGKPKGIMVEHKQFSTFILNFSQKSFIDSLENLNVLSLTSYVFDIFGLEFGLPLSFGSCIYISNFTNINDSHLEKSSIIQQTPNVLSAVCDNEKELLKDMLCLVGGENLVANISAKLLNCFKNVINVYGPAESVIWSSSHKLSKDQDVLIGKPLFNEMAYVLDVNNKAVPIGVIGELHIGGAGLARGYLNKPALTSDKFTPNPFAADGDIVKGYTRLYKTGDLVRWLPDGNLEYIGRNDFQVKIRGYRIELGEIESALTSIASIKQACVLSKGKNGNKYLVGYFVSDTEIAEKNILNHLSKRLPEYMIPTALVKMGSFPLTINGKLDWKAFPDPEFTDEDSYQAPTTDLEIKLCNIWQEVLQLEKVGITDDFFRIGGDSILSIKLIYKMNKDLSEKKIKFNITDLFEHKNIKLLLSNVFTENSSHNLIKNLSVIDNNKKQIFFVHPGNGGCEVYTDLANNLKNRYNSFGIDNFNILNDENISSLNLLANEYVNAVPDFKQADEINLCGWSLGGQLALEIGHILEQNGFININICLLDTVIQDEYIINHNNKRDEIEFKQKIREHMISEGYENDYVNKVIRASKAEKEISKQAISGRLKSGKVILFKALQEDKRIEYEGRKKIYKYTQSLKDNNVGQFVKNLEVINLECNHGNILEYLIANDEYSDLL